MEGNKSKPRALLVFGAPCSGKTTFAKKFSAKYNLTYYDLDELVRKYSFSREIILTILELIAKTKQTLIIEGGIGTEKDRSEIRHILILAGYDVSLFWVQTDVNTIKTRMKARYKSVSKAKNIYDVAVSSLEAPSLLEKPIILSGKHTFETQTRHALAGLADVNS